MGRAHTFAAACGAGYSLIFHHFRAVREFVHTAEAEQY
jgi:hypothetical protein